MLSKIKYEYYSKLFDDLISQNKLQDIKVSLDKISDNPNLFYNLSRKYSHHFLKNTQLEIIKPKIVWLNSYLPEIGKDIDNFISYYLSNFQKNIFKINSFEKEIKNLSSRFPISKSINLHNAIESSIIYQWLIQLNSSSSYNIISNHSAFYSTPEGYNFTNSNLTQSFFLLIIHPYKLYQIMKTKFDGEKSLAQNFLLNLDQRPIAEKIDDFEFEINRKSWPIFNQSWIDTNVVDSLKGKIIKIEDFYKDPEETLISIVMHLIQSGIKIELNYDLIGAFLSDNNFDENIFNNTDLKISNSEKKFLDRNISVCCEKLDYSLDQFI